MQIFHHNVAGADIFASLCAGKGAMDIFHRYVVFPSRGHSLCFKGLFGLAP